MPVFFDFSIYFPRQVEESSAAPQHVPIMYISLSLLRNAVKKDSPLRLWDQDAAAAA